MIRKTITALAATTLALALSACGDGSADEPSTTTDHAESESSSSETNADGPGAKMGDLAEGVEGQVGFRHGIDCVSAEECSVNFTVQELTPTSTCEGYSSEEPPSDTHLVKMSALVEVHQAEPLQIPHYDPTLFAASTSWSALDPEGVDVPLRSSHCTWMGDGQQWSRSVYPGIKPNSPSTLTFPMGLARSG